MKSMTRTLAAAAALALVAAPAYAQNINTGATGMYGQTQLRAGFEPDPFTVSVLGGGPIEATTVNADCYAGYLAQRASYTLRYTANTAEFPTLYIGATSDADTTVAVRTPNGQWICNDDSNGLNPMVAIEAPRNGRYQIWVGRFGAQNEQAQATLFVSEVAPDSTDATTGDAPDFSLEPAYGVLDLAGGFTPDPHTVAIDAGGTINASVIGEQCLGWIARAPDYRVNWTSGSLPLIFSVAAETDTTLVINDAEGNWVCDDDGGNEGLNPAITFATPASGQYDVWVGTYSEGDLQPSTLHVSELYSQ